MFQFTSRNVSSKRGEERKRRKQNERGQQTRTEWKTKLKILRGEGKEDERSKTRQDCKCLFFRGEERKREERTSDEKRSEGSYKQDKLLMATKLYLWAFQCLFLTFLHLLLSLSLFLTLHLALSLSPSLPPHSQGSSKSRWRPLTSNMLPQFPW